MIKCMIIDDEPLALDILEAYIGRVPFLSLAARCNEPLTALEHLGRETIDLLFLDINMPDINGISLFKSLPVRPQLIFTTAYSEYAVDGFELDALDYLLKPISFERFVTSVNRAKDGISKKEKANMPSREYFFINAAHKIYKIFYEDILFLEGLKDYTKIHLLSQSTPLLILQNLKYFEDSLPADGFIRIHRSYIVALSKLNTITRKSVNIGNNSMPVSDNYREKLFAMIQG